MAVVTYPQANSPQGNFWAQVKDFSTRGGFFNGLNPSIVGRIWYVNTNTDANAADLKGPVGSDSNDGRSPNTPFATVARAFTFIDCYDIIVIDGVVKEQLVSPTGVFDVTIIGGANRPRQATSSGDPTGGGSYWTYPASPTAATPLIEVVNQGWKFVNICFNPYTSSGAIRVTASATVDLTDGGHCIADSCYFVGGGSGQIGIENNGGSGFCLIQNSRFLLLAAAVKCLSTSKAIPLAWEFYNNWFSQNTNDIISSLSYSIIQNNHFMTAGSGSTNKVINTTYNSSQGGHNHVTLNFFSNAEVEIAPGNGFTGASTDLWQNYVNDQAALAFGQPA